MTAYCPAYCSWQLLGSDPSSFAPYHPMRPVLSTVSMQCPCSTECGVSAVSFSLLAVGSWARASAWGVLRHAGVALLANKRTFNRFTLRILSLLSSPDTHFYSAQHYREAEKQLLRRKPDSWTRCQVGLRINNRQTPWRPAGGLRAECLLRPEGLLGSASGMAVKAATVWAHLLLFSVICVLAHEVSDFVLDEPPDGVRDRVSQHMVRLYEKYKRAPHWPKNTNTVRSFKAKPGKLGDISSSIWTLVIGWLSHSGEKTIGKKRKKEMMLGFKYKLKKKWRNGEIIH